MVRLGAKCNLWLVGMVMVLSGGCDFFGEPTVSGKALEGRVLDAVSNAPIEGAIVVARWQGHAGYSGTVCFHVETAVTDDRGVYAIPAWEKKTKFAGLPYKQVVLAAHKPGYQWSSRYAESVQYLEPFRGTREEQLKYVMRVSSGTSCGSQDESEENLLPLLKVLYGEAVKLARTKEEIRLVGFILYDIEKIELGFEEAERRFLERP